MDLHRVLANLEILYRAELSFLDAVPRRASDVPDWI